MNCFRPKTPKTPQMPQESSRAVTHELLLSIPGSKAHLVDAGEAVELASGVFTIWRIAEDGVSVATTVKVGDDLQWPLTRDEPVVKLAALNYLFTIPVRDGNSLSYGVTFSEGDLRFLDSFLKEHCLFSTSKTLLSDKKKKGSVVDWKEFAPRVDDYNNFLAKAIAGGTGQIVKGIFICSNAYANQVYKGGETILSPAGQEKSGVNAIERKNSVNGAAKKSAVNNSLQRARKLSQMTEKMSKAMLDGVGVATGSIMGPMVRSQAGKKFLSMVPGEVLLASLDAVNKVLDAAEAAERQAFSATSGAVTKMVSQRFGENAGEATQDALATAGHTVGTAWNVFKIRKAITPGSSVTSGVRNAAKNTRR
ncbi:senescence/dehydration-associated protein At4g35985, chloroplastic-like [Ipomoea triloba]|uniref:senescence/dehydration-associated protein At4g35985, chloroplastic-like n=1 Tax=Ipomoea triloba TaxID=35885 RepID=UPI00125D6D75|nr:senescence/dehydration-associated protein At4g35985, chloroplastic-like [Ipomoea triloba]